jgi:hypothetical protein
LNNLVKVWVGTLGAGCIPSEVVRRSALPHEGFETTAAGNPKTLYQRRQLGDPAAGRIRGQGILSRRSRRSILSYGSTGSILSVGSAGSILSVFSVGSILSIGSVASLLSILGYRTIRNRKRLRKAIAQ